MSVSPRKGPLKIFLCPNSEIVRAKQLNFSCCIIKAMTRKAVITRIRKHRAQLTKLGVKSLSLFGSVARGEERSDSDVDILVEFKGKATLDRYMDTKFYLEDLLERKVDLVTPKAIKPRMKPRIMQDLVHVA